MVYFVLGALSSFGLRDTGKEWLRTGSIQSGEAGKLIFLLFELPVVNCEDVCGDVRTGVRELSANVYSLSESPSPSS